MAVAQLVIAELIVVPLIAYEGKVDEQNAAPDPVHTAQPDTQAEQVLIKVYPEEHAVHAAPAVDEAKVLHPVTVVGATQTLLVASNEVAPVHEAASSHFAAPLAEHLLQNEPQARQAVPLRE